MGKSFKELRSTVMLPIKSFPNAETLLAQGDVLIANGHEALRHFNYSLAIQQFEQAIQFFKSILSDRPHDVSAREGLLMAWTAISNVFPSLEVSRFGGDTQLSLLEITESSHLFQKIKSALIDHFVESSWKIQCDGKYGGPKPTHLTWKQFYEENENAMERLSKKDRFFWAVKQGHVKLLATAVKYANVNERSNHQDPPLFFAIQKRYSQVAKMLLDEGASVAVKGVGQWTAIHWASYQANYDLIELLIKKKSSINVAEANGFMPLHFASYSGDVESVKLLLSKKAKVNAAANDGTTPLFWAVYSGRLDVVALLLEHDAKLDARDFLGRTVLFWAMARGSRDIVKLLLSSGIGVDDKDQFGRTPLHWAAECGDYDSVYVLIEGNAKVNEEDHYGDRPMLLAALHQHSKVVSLLFQKGAR